MAWANHFDVLNLWVGPPNGAAPPEGADDQIDSLCQIAEFKIKRSFPAIQSRIDDDEELAELAKYVVVQMVQALYQNPLGLRYFQNQTGPFAHSGNYGASVAVLMSLSEEQKELLAPTISGAASMTDLDSNRDRTGPYTDLSPWVINLPETD